MIARRIGSRWSPQSAAAGFVAPSTQVPKTIAGRIALGQSLVTYFTSNPTFERPDMEVTAAKAAELTDAAVDGEDAVSTAEQAFKSAGEARVPAKTNLLDLMSTLVANLDKKLAADDPRWLAFGLQLPSTPTTPAAPTGLRATIMGNEILLECDPKALATRYRFRTKIVGLDTRYKLAASGQQPMAVLEGVAMGITLEIVAQAVNGPAQSVASNPILVTMPTAAAAAKPETTMADVELAPLSAIVPNGNGNGNGSHAVSRLS